MVTNFSGANFLDFKARSIRAHNFRSIWSVYDLTWMADVPWGVDGKQGRSWGLLPRGQVQKFAVQWHAHRGDARIFEMAGGVGRRVGSTCTV